MFVFLGIGLLVVIVSGVEGFVCGEFLGVIVKIFEYVWKVVDLCDEMYIGVWEVFR